MLATDRGRGVFQPAIDRAIDVLDTKGWLHIFPEGYVNLSRKARVRRFKWGIGRLLLEARMPIIVPCWISGFDQMMPDPRGFPKWLPRPGARLSVTFGRPIQDELEPLVTRMRKFATQERRTTSAEDLQKQLQSALRGLDSISPSYPIPSPSFFTPPTPLAFKEHHIKHPPESRSFQSLSEGMDEPRARLARSAIASELRAHLVKLGEESGMSTSLAHRLMSGAES